MTEAAKQAIERHEDTREYWTVCEGKPVKLHWSEMTYRQRQLQREAERRAKHVELFGIYE